MFSRLKNTSKTALLVVTILISTSCVDSKINQADKHDEQQKAPITINYPSDITTNPQALNEIWAVDWWKPRHQQKNA